MFPQSMHSKSLRTSLNDLKDMVKIKFSLFFANVANDGNSFELDKFHIQLNQQ